MITFTYHSAIEFKLAVLAAKREEISFTFDTMTQRISIPDALLIDQGHDIEHIVGALNTPQAEIHNG